MTTEADFLSLTKKRAQDLAERQNLIFRLIRVDNNSMFSYPTDHRDDRVCVEVENGVVVRASFQ